MREIIQDGGLNSEHCGICTSTVLPNLGTDFGLIWWAKMSSNIFIHFWLLINPINPSVSHSQLGILGDFSLKWQKGVGVLFFCNFNQAEGCSICLHPTVRALFTHGLSWDACGVLPARLAGRRSPWRRVLRAFWHRLEGWLCFPSRDCV